jgi:hypothetical protein
MPKKQWKHRHPTELGKAVKKDFSLRMGLRMIAFLYQEAIVAT